MKSLFNVVDYIDLNGTGKSFSPLIIRICRAYNARRGYVDDDVLSPSFNFLISIYTTVGINMMGCLYASGCYDAKA